MHCSEGGVIGLYGATIPSTLASSVRPYKTPCIKQSVNTQYMRGIRFELNILYSLLNSTILITGEA